jgi:hypothetical protein
MSNRRAAAVPRRFEWCRSARMRAFRGDSQIPDELEICYIYSALRGGSGGQSGGLGATGALRLCTFVPIHQRVTSVLRFRPRYAWKIERPRPAAAPRAKISVAKFYRRIFSDSLLVRSLGKLRAQKIQSKSSPILSIGSVRRILR